MEQDFSAFRQAKEDFKRARAKAAMQRFWSGIRGESLDLLPYDEISTKLKPVSRTDRGLQMVKLADIVGSVGRTDDFNRNFLPLNDADIERWASVKTAMTGLGSKGLSPVKLYKVGDAYFVMDGNHRVSIAREIGASEIEAYVTEVKTRVPISSNITPEELVEKIAYAEFLADTKADSILPGVDLSLSLRQNYDLLKEHISVHRYYMGIEAGHEVSYAEALVDWYDKVYLPVVQMIRSSGLDQEYKGLTLTDLYLWVLDQQTKLQESLGIPIKTENVIDYAAQQEGRATLPTTSKAERQIEEILTLPDQIMSEQAQAAATSPGDCLFRDILVGISLADPEWKAFDQALLVNQCADGQIRGLNVITADHQLSPLQQAELQAKFEQRLTQAGRKGKMMFLQGEVAEVLAEQSLLNDLLVLKLNFPPDVSLFGRFSSGIKELIRKSRRPILMVKEQVLPFQSFLLLYDGSPKS